MYKTCHDLENSLYVAPNEIRSCCQRFFYDGKMRGDAKLIDIKENVTPTFEDLQKAREKYLMKFKMRKMKIAKGVRLSKNKK